MTGVTFSLKYEKQNLTPNFILIILHYFNQSYAFVLHETCTNSIFTKTKYYLQVQ